MTYKVLSGTLNLCSVNQSILPYHVVQYLHSCLTAGAAPRFCSEHYISCLVESWGSPGEQEILCILSWSPEFLCTEMLTEGPFVCKK